MRLEDLGWNEFFDTHFSTFNDATLGPARVTGVSKKYFRVHDGRSETLATVSGRFFHDVSQATLFPTVGDWVVTKGGVIIDVLPRANAISRGASGNRGKISGLPVEVQIIAANIDTAFIVCGLDRDYNLRRIERYLTLVYNCGCSPVVLLNKGDIHHQPEDFVDEVSSVAIGVPVYLISAKAATGLNALTPYLGPGKTVVLMGSSGAGKSTLVNRLAGADIRVAREVSDAVGKGVHTTTSRDLIRLPAGGMIIDNPGIREIAFWENAAGIDGVFPDIEELALGCRFSDCSHLHEPGCRVQEAVQSGDLAMERLENYRKMQRELAYLSERRAKTAGRVEKERWQPVALKVKEIKRNKKGKY